MANRKRNVNFIKPEDPAFLKALKKEAGYDDRNHKFDDLQNEEGDFVDDEDSEQPQVVVLKSGDLTAEEANVEKERLEKEELEKKADLTQKVIFKPKQKSEANTDRKRKEPIQPTVYKKKTKPILSFDDNEEEDEED